MDYGTTRTKYDQREKEKTEYEENYMTRLMDTKKDKQARKKAMRERSTLRNELKDLGDYADIAALDFDGGDDGGTNHFHSSCVVCVVCVVSRVSVA